MSQTRDASDMVAQLVVIGASAGGVEALLSLASELPTDFPAPIVVAQHVDPNRPSQLGPLLASRTRLSVRTVTGSEPLEPGTIYLVPADRDVEISDHHVEVLEHATAAPKPSVDRLMTTAAQTFGDGLISVVLSGTGQDGAAGAQATKAYGGTVIVQNPETARFPGMPQSVALATVDVVADLEAIAPLLVDLVTGAYVQPTADGEDGLRAFLELLRDRTGHDFTVYKPPTITRRLQRRMAAVGRESLDDYRRYIERNPDELQQLVATLLIKVTEFFRDPELFDYLREQVLPTLIEEARERGELRLWSAGCATGEEAYSLAMIVSDLLGDEVDALPVRIFATDVAVDAVEFARRGVYPASAVAHLPPDFVERHFMALDGVYEVRKPVRSLVVFGDHDLGRRAPFPRIDLVLCRNVLIYFATDLQRRALQLFAYALRGGGYLALGKSESVSPLPEFFTLEQPRLKVFRRSSAKMPHVSLPLMGAAIPEWSEALLAGRARRRGMLTPPRVASPTRSSRVDLLLDALAVGIVTVKQNYDIVTINAAARQLLGINTGAIGEDLVHRVHSSLALPLREALDAALRGETATVRHRVPADVLDEDGRDLSIVCSPFWQGDAPGDGAAVLVEVSDITEPAQRLRALEEEQRALQAQHATLRDQADNAAVELRELRAINQSMATEEARLRTEVELMQVAHEEVQAAAEEIETLNEEQQATNEELETVNEELQATVEELHATVGELSATNDELQARTIQLEGMAATVEEQRLAAEAEWARLSAILENMGDAVLVVDEEGRTVLTNAAFDQAFDAAVDIVPLDETGRPLHQNLWPVRRAAAGETFTLAFSLLDADGQQRAFESNAQPVQAVDGQRWGVIVFRDITDRSLRHQQEQFLAVAAHELRTPLTVLSGRIQLLSRRLAKTNADERVKEHVTRALEQARSLEADIDELLDAARLQFGRTIIETLPVDLVTIVTRAVDAAESLTTGQTIHVDVPPAPVMIQGDERRLSRVLLNVLTNAITYAPGTDRIDARLVRDEREAVIEVEDRGPGIPAEALPRIFGRFVRIEQGPSSRGGLGLGLFIAREIITAHGGTIDARSTPGAGATIVIRLPLLDESTSPEATAGSPS